MSDEKFEWSEQQPADWTGEPLGTPVNWAPPTTPPIGPTPVAQPVSKVRFSDVFSLIRKTLRAHSLRYIGIASGIAAITGIVSAFVASRFYESGSITDGAVALLIKSETGLDKNNPTTEQIQTFLDNSVSLLGFLVVMVAISALASFFIQTLITARAVSDMSANPGQRFSTFSWWRVIRLNLASVVILIVAALPMLVALFFWGGDETGSAALDAILVIAFVGFLLFVLWFSFSTVISLPHAIVNEKGGFKILRETIALTKGMRGTAFLILMVVSIPVSLLANSIQSIIKELQNTAAAETQLISFAVTQSLMLAISIPLTSVAVSALYVIRRSLNR